MGAAQAAIPQTERDALIALYNSTNGAHWIYRDNWRNSGDTDFNDPGTECNWHGVTCDLAQAHVVKVDLRHNELSGTIPKLSGLPQLQVFDVSSNQLSGTIPDLSGLNQLQFFVVWNNQLSGPIPDLSGLPQLQGFNARENQLSGTIPDLSGLPQLLGFNARENQLSGPIPDLGGLNQLQYFDVGDNQLSGAIPDISGLNRLQRFWVDNNLLTGKPPAAPTGLRANESSLCPNKLETPSPTDAAWNTATGSGNWSDGCSATAHTVTAQAGPNGSVGPASQQRVSGATALLAFTPAAGYAFDQATPAPSCGSVTITRYNSTYLEIKPIEADCDIQVSFKLLPGHHAITATANPSAGGSVSCLPSTVPNGDSSTCTATASSGYTFVDFSGDCTSTSGNTCTLTNVTSPKRVTANFRATATTATVTANVTGGHGAVAPPSRTVNVGQPSTFTLTPDTGYVPSASVGGNCGAGSFNGNDYTVARVSADCALQFRFQATAPGTHAITATASPGAGGTVSCSPSPVPNGRDARCTASANPGYAFDGFGGDCTSTSGNTCTLTSVTGPKAVTARFRLIGAPPSSSATPVPTLGHWALMLLGLLTAALGLQRLRRS